jgi:hypothetical protein
VHDDGTDGRGEVLALDCPVVFDVAEFGGEVGILHPEVHWEGQLQD